MILKLRRKEFTGSRNEMPHMERAVKLNRMKCSEDTVGRSGHAWILLIVTRSGSEPMLMELNCLFA